MTPPLTSHALARLLAENDRRLVFATLVLSPCPRSAVAEAAGLPQRQAITALDRLIEAGLVAVDESGLCQVDDAAIVEMVRSEAPPAAPSEHGDEPVEVAAILDKAIVDGRLAAWPAKRSKRLVVLDWLVQGFEPGLRYKEQQVNLKLRQFTDDVATMRRYLVDDGFLDRADGVYWRSGGSVQ